MSTKAPAVTLEYVKTIGIVNNGDNGRGFANPYDIAVTRDGRICVLNRCDPPRALSIRVGICNLDEEYLSEFRLGYGDGDGQVTLPVCLAFDSRERLHVTDENNHRVSVFDLSGKFLDRWGSPGSGDGELDGAAGIAIDSNDDVYVADQHNNRIQKFDRDGVYLSQWGSHGSGAGQLDMPWGLAVDREDNVYVADWRNDRVQKFSSEGRFLASFGESGRGDGQLHRPSGVAVDADGNIYVSDWGNERLQVLRPRRRLTVERARPRHAVEVGEGLLRLQPGRDVHPGAVGPDIGAARASAGAVPRVVADGALLLGPNGGFARLRGQGLHTRDEPPPLPGIPAQVGLAPAGRGQAVHQFLVRRARNGSPVRGQFMDHSACPLCGIQTATGVGENGREEMTDRRGIGFTLGYLGRLVTGRICGHLQRRQGQRVESRSHWETHWYGFYATRGAAIDAVDILGYQLNEDVCVSWD